MDRCYMDGVVFFFRAGFLVVFFADLLAFCAADAPLAPITAAAGSTTAAPKAQSMAAITSCFIVDLHCRRLQDHHARLAPITNQSGELLTRLRIFVDGRRTLAGTAGNGPRAEGGGVEPTSDIPRGAGPVRTPRRGA